MKLSGEEQAALALITYPVIAAFIAALTHNPYAALTTTYIIALALRGTVSNMYTRTLLIVSSLAIIPLTPLLTTPSIFHAQIALDTLNVKSITVHVEKIPLPFHVLLVYHDPHTDTTSRVLALDWGQIGLATLLVELYLYRKAKKP